MSRFQPIQSKYYSGFNPLGVGGCALWLDAADPSTVTLSGSNVTQWRDKANSVAFTASSTNPTVSTTKYGGQSAIQFGGSAYFSNSSFVYTIATHSTFVVVGETSTHTNNAGILSFGTSGTDYNRTNAKSYNTAYGPNNWYFGMDQAFQAGGFSTGLGANTPTPFALYSDTFGAGTLTGYMNGTQSNTATSAATFSDSTGLLIGARSTAGSPSGPITGVIAEVILFTRVLSTIERQQVESYLANKWGLRSNLPANHLYKKINPITRPFTPVDISGCTLWLDAADQTSITFLSNNRVAVWGDKSGLGRNAVQATPANQPTYSNNQIIISNGSNVWLTSTASLPAASHTIFGVHTPSNDVSRNNRFISFQGGSGTAWVVFPYSQSGQQPPRGYGNSGSAALGGATSILREFSIPGQTNIISAVISSGSQSIYKSGVLQTTSNAAITASTSQTLVIGNGRPANSTEVYAGNIGEIITYSRPLNVQERVLVEGYLTRKWGVTNLLPGSSSVTAIPTSFTGCALWLDAADSSTITLSGSTVTRWADKSGNGRDASGGVAPTYTSNAINNSNVVTFNGTTTFLNTANVYSGQNFMISVVFQRNAAIPGPALGPLIGGSTSSSLLLLFSTSTNLRLSFYAAALNYASFPTYTAPDPAYLVTAVFTPYTRRIFLNGLGVAFDSNSATLGAFAVPYLGRHLTNYFNGSIAELVVYNQTYHLDEQRRAIEGYLINKWNIQGTPAPHLYKNMITSTVAFNPAQVPTCTLWLDSTDYSTLTLSGSNVTVWGDKSGNGRDASGGVSPIYTSNGIQFNGSSYLLTNAPAGSNTATYFVVFNSSNTSNAAALIGGSVSSSAVIYLSNSNAVFGNWVSAVATNPTTLSPSVTYLTTATASTGTLSVSINGGTFTTGAASFTGTTATLKIGTGFTDNRLKYSGLIYEIIAYNSVLASAQRQQIEGYLAWKWGIARDPTPTLTYTSFSPVSSVSGCTIWLDAKDESAITYAADSSSNVSTWVDKSGNGRDATVISTNYATRTSNNTGMVFSNSFYSTTLPASPSSETMFVVFTFNSVTSDTNNMILSSPDAGGRFVGIYEYGGPPSIGAGVDAVQWGPIISGPSRYTTGLATLKTVSGTSSSISYNGGIVVSGPAMTFTSSSNTQIGMASTNAIPFIGSICEIIAHDSVLGTTDTQNIEGYLARKWGLQSSLPTTHPYYSLGGLPAAHPYKRINPA